MTSIKSRLTLVSMVVLVVFMVLTAVALERAIVKRALQAEEDSLQLLIYSLLGAVDRDVPGLSITVSNERLFEPGLVTQGSGLYAALFNSRQQPIWQSRSVTLAFPPIDDLVIGEWQFDNIELEQNPYFRLGFALQWPDIRDNLQRYDVVVWHDASDYYQQLERFRQTLWTWLLITTCLLLLVMYLVLRWSLKPLEKIGLEVKAIEDQRQSGFELHYPDEIAPLTENLNILLKREQFQSQRYRHAMDDLAHSLKTPLAVLTGLADDKIVEAAQIETLREQTDRMNQIVSYQLQKATSVASVRINKAIELTLVINKLLSALEKVYREKSIKLESNLEPGMLLRMDEGDCLETIGNLLDNAFKYGKSRVQLDASIDENNSVHLRIEDDGAGLEESEIEQILSRGTRLDEATEGQGIGLAVVADIVESYNIDMQFRRSSLGGLRVDLVFQRS
ncbi:MAG: two-component system sensor histidine kinase PhoQ [Planctomycetota bacterium]|jgi:two-component system sensor histidine kinase PhoQ